MSNTYKNNPTNAEGSIWRNYQTRLKRDAARERIYKTTIKCTVLFILFLPLGHAFIKGPGKVVYHRIHAIRNTLSEGINLALGSQVEKQTHSKPLISKEEVRAFLDSQAFLNLKEESFDYDHGGRTLRIDTCIDPSLQHFMLDKLDRENSRYIGIVAMDPSTGRVLSMVGFNKINPSNNPCLSNKFPAASIFKIVTAAAAIEECGFDSETVLTYNGDKHTLYRSQLKERKNRYTRRITLRQSFAQSINPVFGKIGAHYLKKSDLEKYAVSFGFNRNIDFEIPVPPSVLTLTDKPYHQAEIASGFNRKTILSPLHGALMIAAILNSGQMTEPTIVDQITDKKGHTIYRSRVTPLQQACSQNSTHVLKELMHETIRSGTCKKAFQDHRSDPILSRLYIGGKSGSISNKARDARFDWFVGFAEEKDGPVKVAISVVVAHEKYIGIRANRYAHMMIKRYFSNYSAKIQPQLNKT